MASDLHHVQHPNVAVSEEKVPSPHYSHSRFKQLGIDIDVFLEPLMQEMERLWRHRGPMYDAFKKEDFICRAMIFVTTNDYPTLFALSGQMKGKMGCLVCLDGTTWVFLDASRRQFTYGID
jgi:hypothetical protein